MIPVSLCFSAIRTAIVIPLVVIDIGFWFLLIVSGIDYKQFQLLPASLKRQPNAK
jgi:hypothetical protein